MSDHIPEEAREALEPDIVAEDDTDVPPREEVEFPVTVRVEPLDQTFQIERPSALQNMQLTNKHKVSDVNHDIVSLCKAYMDQYVSAVEGRTPAFDELDGTPEKEKACLFFMGFFKRHFLLGQGSS